MNVIAVCLVSFYGFYGALPYALMFISKCFTICVLERIVVIV